MCYSVADDTGGAPHRGSAATLAAGGVVRRGVRRRERERANPTTAEFTEETGSNLFSSREASHLCLELHPSVRPSIFSQCDGCVCGCAVQVRERARAPERVRPSRSEVKSGSTARRVNSSAAESRGETNKHQHLRSRLHGRVVRTGFKAA